jgi:hypothetical protein
LDRDDGRGEQPGREQHRGGVNDDGREPRGQRPRDELAHGRYDYRIGDPRKDEIGELYAEFDRTAEALDARQSGVRPPAG